MRRPLCLAHFRDDPVVMNAFRRSLRGLVSKLALFYLLLSLPTLLVVETVVMSWEFQGFLAGVKTGSLNRSAAKGGSELESLWPHMRLGAQPDSLTLSTWLEGWLLRLQQPKVLHPPGTARTSPGGCHHRQGFAHRLDCARPCHLAPRLAHRG